MVPERREDPRLPWSLPERPLGSAPGPGGRGWWSCSVGAAGEAGIEMAWGWRGHCVRGVSVCRPNRGREQGALQGTKSSECSLGPAVLREAESSGLAAVQRLAEHRSRSGETAR